MEHASISKLKAHFSKYIRMVQQHEKTVLITKRGQPIALLQPTSFMGSAEAAEGALQALARTGQVRRPRHRLSPEFFLSSIRPGKRQKKRLMRRGVLDR